MQLKVTDSTGATQTVVVAGLESPVDKSNSITVTGQAQVLAAANAVRSGFIVQNVSSHVMWVNDLADAAAGAGSYQLSPGAVFPPPGWPMSTHTVSVLGTAGDAFTAREW